MYVLRRCILPHNQNVSRPVIALATRPREVPGAQELKTPLAAVSSYEAITAKKPVVKGRSEYKERRKWGWVVGRERRRGLSDRPIHAVFAHLLEVYYLRLVTSSTLQTSSLSNSSSAFALVRYMLLAHQLY